MILSIDEKRRIICALVEFVERVSSAEGKKTPEEIAALPAILKFLSECKLAKLTETTCTLIKESASTESNDGFLPGASLPLNWGRTEGPLHVSPELPLLEEVERLLLLSLQAYLLTKHSEKHAPNRCRRRATEYR